MALIEFFLQLMQLLYALISNPISCKIDMEFLFAHW